MDQIRCTLEAARGLEGIELEQAIGLYEIASSDLLAYYCSAKPEESKKLGELEKWISDRITTLKGRLYLHQYSAEDQKPCEPQQGIQFNPPPVQFNQPQQEIGSLPPHQQLIQQLIHFDQPSSGQCPIKFDQPPQQSNSQPSSQQNAELPSSQPPPPTYQQVIDPPPPSYQQATTPPPPSYQQATNPPPSYQQVIDTEEEEEEQEQQEQQLPPKKVIPSHDAFMKSFRQNRTEEQRKSLMKSMAMRNRNGPLGLKNNGQNNCFMNAVIQSLWNLSVFSSEFSEAEKHKCTHDHKCVFCALQIIFASLKYSSETVDPFGLRCALDALSSNFEMKKMADASEAFTYILDELHKATEQEESGFNCCIVHNIFSIDILAIKTCGCGFASDDMSHTRSWTSILPAQYLVDTHAKAPGMPFGKILGEYDRGEPTKCPNCSKVALSSRRDFDPKLPKVFTISAVWGYTPKTEDLASFVRFVPQEFNMEDVVPGANAAYRIRGMVVFYGMHYYTYFYKLRAGSDTVHEWKMFDDSLVKPVGTWDDLIRILVRGHIQPVLLFYVKV